MTTDKIFVGRKAELEQFKKVLEDPKGQAILVVGHRGMGKTWLINKIAELAEIHPNLKCGCVRYEVTPTDSVDSTMAQMMDNAFEAAQIEDGSFSGTARRLEQWRSLLNVINLGDLIMSLRRNPAKNTRDQFLERLQLISKEMPENGRAIFIIDPEKYMQKDSDQSWAIVVKGLPDKIKLVFAQRTEDVLVESATFTALDNISHIPEKRLDALEEQAVDELLDKRVTDMDYTVTEVRRILSKYKGHPYALQGALDLLKTGTKLEELPKDPAGIASAQWKQLCKRGKDAIRLFKAYAILEVGVSDEVVTAVSELDTDTLQSTLADNFLDGLLREDGYGKRIYHAILADYIVDQLSDAEKKQYHNRTVELYRQMLAKARKQQTQPDALAATRLTEHVLAAEGKKAFLFAFVNDCFPHLKTLGMLDAAISLSERALAFVPKDSEEDAVVKGNLGIIFCQLGRYEESRRLHQEALIINRTLNRPIGVAGQHVGLGLAYYGSGAINKAEQEMLKAITIFEEHKDKSGLASAQGNLCLFYTKRKDYCMAKQSLRKAMENANETRDFGVITSCLVHVGILCGEECEFDQAEQMFSLSLEMFDNQGHVEGVATVHANLGVLYNKSGQLNKARKHWDKALELFKRIGMKPEIEEVQGWLDKLKEK